MEGNVLISDDDKDVVSSLAYLLKMEGYSTQSAYSPSQALKMLGENDFDLLLADLNYTSDTTSGQEGLELVSKSIELGFLGQIVTMTAWGSVELAVEAMRRGAHDFIQKPWDNERLLSIVRNQLLLGKAEQKSLALEEKNKLLRQQLDIGVSPIIAESPAMKELLLKIEQVAQSDVPILFTGENGTGKSLLAERVHLLSNRKNMDLISVNMGAISEYLFESEMFGHVKGAFTDAKEGRIGRFELANNGTLFLDEIGNTPYSHQGKLLRVLESEKFERAGSATTRTTNCRLITATNCDLKAAVSEDRFRKDLLYRINTITLRIPPLRERVADIEPLAIYQLEKFKRKYKKSEVEISSDVMEAFQSYSWPGNIRELSHLIERAVIFCNSNKISLADIGMSLEEMDDKADEYYEESQLVAHKRATDSLDIESATLEEIESAVIASRLEKHSGNTAKAAKSLGLSKSAIYRRLSKS